MLTGLYVSMSYFIIIMCKLLFFYHDINNKSYKKNLEKLINAINNIYHNV